MAQRGFRCLAVVSLAFVSGFPQLAASANVGDFVASGFGLSSTTAVAAGPFTNSSADSCWASWEEYWSYKHAAATPQQSDVATILSTTTGVVPAYAGTTETDVGTSKGLSMQNNGGFTISTRTIDSTWTSLYTFSARHESSYTRTNTFTSYTLISYDGTPVPTPTCHLPSVVSQCQSQWEAYVSSELLPSPNPPSHCDINQGIVPVFTWETQLACASTYQASLSSWRSQLSSITKPPCTQASIGGSLCSTVKDAYVHQQNSIFFPEVDFAPYFSNGYLGSFANITAQNYTKSWWWPTSSTLGVPGCTLGCGRCAVTGGTVQLLYWPEATSSAAAAGEGEPVTLSTLGTVLTSPTYYVSYKSVFASDGCSGIGPTLYDTIVPIPASLQLSSVFAGTLPCVAHVQNQFTQEWTATASFNVKDMEQPVPFSIYSSQPWCATYQFEHGCKKECPTTDAYKPIIVVPEEVLQSMNPEWASCYGDIRGAYDPPIALTRADSVIVPQMTSPMSTTSEIITASPEHSPSQPAAQTATATALSEERSPSNDGGSTPQASQSPCHGDDSGSGPCSWLQGSPSQGGAPHASQSSYEVGNIVASILGGVAQSMKPDSSSPQSVSLADPMSEQNVPQSFTQDSDGGTDQPSEAVVASEEATSFETMTQDPHGWPSKLSPGVMASEEATRSTTMTEDEGKGPSKPYMAGVASESSAQPRTTQHSGGSQVSIASESGASASDADSTGAAMGSLTDITSMTPDSASNVPHTVSSQRSTAGAQGSASSASGSDVESTPSLLAAAAASASHDRRSLCSLGIMVAVCWLIIL